MACFSLSFWLGSTGERLPSGVSNLNWLMSLASKEALNSSVRPDSGEQGAPAFSRSHVRLALKGSRTLKTKLSSFSVGVPFAALLSAVMLMLCIAQLGPTLVLLPAVAWVFWTGDTGWGVFLLGWTLIVGTLDNFLRPMLIKKGADLPLLLIFAGVIGGLFGFGLVGIFVGPVVLAVTYTLLEAWVADAMDNPGQSRTQTS